MTGEITMSLERQRFGWFRNGGMGMQDILRTCIGKCIAPNHKEFIVKVNHLVFVTYRGIVSNCK